MHRFTDASFPWWDASVAMISIAAQILMSVRRIENWWLWIAANMLSIGLYAAKALWITTGLYVILLAISIWGLIVWKRARAWETIGNGAAAKLVGRVRRGKPPCLSQERYYGRFRSWPAAPRRVSSTSRIRSMR